MKIQKDFLFTYQLSNTHKHFLRLDAFRAYEFLMSLGICNANCIADILEFCMSFELTFVLQNYYELSSKSFHICTKYKHKDFKFLASLSLYGMVLMNFNILSNKNGNESRNGVLNAFFTWHNRFQMVGRSRAQDTRLL